MNEQSSELESEGSSEIRDISIIGAGPTGIFAAFQCGMNDLTCRLIDSMPQAGGQLTALYPEKFIYDVAGFPRVTASQLIETLMEQAEQFSPEYILESQVTSLQKNDDGTFTITTSTGDSYLSKAVIIAAGLGAFSPRKLDQLGDVSTLEGHAIHYSVKSISDFEGKRVVVIGGGDSALDWAVTLLKVATSVTLVHRMKQFQAHGKTVADAMEASEEGKMKIFLNTELVGIDHYHREIQKLHFVQKPDHFSLQADVLLPLIGYKSDLGPIKEWGLELDGNKVKVGSDMKTSVEGIYAAGDVVSYPNKLYIIQTGLGDATMAVRSSLGYIKPHEKIKHQFSSIKMASKSK
ncbi:MAG: NAD(P)/FAD-dependent oxidoreductase [Chloroherpetonaceae bacterium]|nr:NAD(P)/FAD-dependent oxidoreductase [Chloroherpetonaceae bacterium]